MAKKMTYKTKMTQKIKKNTEKIKKLANIERNKIRDVLSDAKIGKRISNKYYDIWISDLSDLINVYESILLGDISGAYSNWQSMDTDAREHLNDTVYDLLNLIIYDQDELRNHEYGVLQ